MATLIARLGKEGGYKQVVVEFRSNGKPVDVPGATAYLIRFTENGRRTTEPAGSELNEAVGKFRRRQALETGTVELVQDFKENAKTAGQGRTSLNAAVENYLVGIEDDFQKQKLAKSSYVSYKKAVEDFAKFCFTQAVQFLDQITAKTLLDHESWLRKTLPKRQGDPIYTIASRFRYLNIFLAQNGIKMAKDRRSRPGDTGLLDHSKVPTAPKRSERDPYEQEEVKGLLETAQRMTENENWKSKRNDKNDGGFLYRRDAQTALDLIHFALKTGFRDGEMGHAEWDDIDWKRKTITTGPKPKYQWTTKSGKSRTIKIPSLIDRLQRRQEEQSPQSQLIFPTDVNTPDNNLIWYLQEVVKRAKIEGLRVKGKIGLHRFRYTTADFMIEQPDFNIEDLRVFLGHADIKTTWLYLRASKKREEKAAQTAFQAFGD